MQRYFIDLTYSKQVMESWLDNKFDEFFAIYFIDVDRPHRQPLSLRRILNSTGGNTSKKQMECMSKDTKFARGKEIFETMQEWLRYREGVPEYDLRYALMICQACEEYSHDTPISKEVIYEYLEKAEKEDKRIQIVPDDEFLPGGPRHGQCDGWRYHPVLISKNIYTDEEEYWATGGNTGILPNRVTPSIIKTLYDDEIFVFGSNKQGLHIGGAARIAYQQFGAEWGNGEGLQGQSYALPTMEGKKSLEEAVNRFIDFAKEHAKCLFYVTPVGCGIAGYSSEDVAPLFAKAIELENVYLPLSFWKIMMKKK